MQDPYSAMMSSHQRSDSYKVYNRQGSATPQTNATGAVPNFYPGLQGYGNQYTTNDMYQSMSMPSNMGGAAASPEFNTPLPAHMGGGGGGGGAGQNGLSRLNPTTHTITHPATSPTASSPPNTALGALTMSSPGPLTSRVSLSPEGTPITSSHQHVSSTHSPGEIVTNESSDSNDIKLEAEDDNGVPPKKRPLAVAPEPRDDSYWEKRKKNNESAKRSREARRMKEEQVALRVVYLEQENLQLKTEVNLLKNEIEKLRCMLYNTS